MMLCPLRLDIDPVPEDSSPTTLIDDDLVRKHCRIDADDENLNLDLYKRMAIEWAENTMHRTVLAREHRWVLREFPSDYLQQILLPRGKTVSVDSITYYRNGSAIDLTGPSSGSPVGTDWQEDLRGDRGGVLMPPRGTSWPSADEDVPAPVTITFTAGYEPSAIPPSILHAILFAISDAYDMRSSADVSAQSLAEAGKYLAPRNALISSWMLSRWY